MAEAFDDSARAFAIDRTLMLYSDYQAEFDRTAEIERFRGFKLDFSRMDEKKQLA